MVEYTDVANTGIAWLPQISQHWEVRKLKYAFNERSEKGYPDEPLLVSSQNMGVVPKSVYGKRTVEALKDLDKLKLVKVGDYVVSLRSFQGGIEYAYYQGIISPAYTIMEPHEDFKSDYYKFLFKSVPFIKLLTTCVTGIREGQNIDYKKLKNIQIPVPPRAEQDQIVRFLDWKVSEINKLIGIRKKEIQELEELRRLTIINSVSNNGEIESSDWKTAKVKRICRMQSGTNLVSQVIDNKGKYPVYGGNGLRGYYKEYTNNGQYVLIGRQGALAGNVHLVDGKFWATDHAVVVYCSDYLDYKYAYYMFTGMNLNQYAFDTAAQPGLSVTKVLNLKCSFPSIKKQLEIVRRVDELCLRYDNAIRIAKSKIQLLQELKSVIISDVVTGKIDVRNVTVPEYEHVDDIVDDDSENNEETETDGEEA